MSHISGFINEGRWKQKLIIRGYIRVSSVDQNPQRQEQALKEMGADIVYIDKMSGGTRQRPQLAQMLDDLQPGDEVLIKELSRFSRSTVDTFDLVEEIRAKGASLKSLAEPWLDTRDDSPQSQFLLTVFSALSELERGMIRQRQKEGIAIAKKEGKYKGRPPKLTTNNPRVRVALEEYAKGERSVREIAQLYSISRSSLYRLAKEEEITR
ncbi:recombinase family protein [Desmospora activa]|uniref:recombinase family protein n=1 Tax=Desmospora activa TaxID=500615 RepID=UPI000D324D3E